jgi:hypothetical protein
LIVSNIIKDGFVINETIFKMKKSTILCLALFLFFNYKSFSQDYNLQPKHVIEAQFGANSPVVSLKYQRYFWLTPQQHITFSVGYGLFYGINFNQGLTYSIGNGRNFFESGILGLYTSSYLDYRKNYQYYILPMAGYKYISPKWFSARVHFSPYFIRGEFRPHAGISFGFHFNERAYIKSNNNINSIRFRRE